MARQEFSGAAARTTLASGISGADLSFTVASGTGYPSGTNSFVIVIDRGLPTEEKILCDSRSGATFTVNASGRGYDGTSAQAHASGAYVEHTVSAAKLDELDAFVNSAFTGDVTATAGSKVLAIAANAVGTAEIADDAVTLDKLVNATTNARFLARSSSGAGNWEEITAAQALAILALDSTDLSDFTEAVQDVIGGLSGLGGNGVTFTYDDAGNAVSLVVNVDGSTIEINSDALRVKDLGITAAKLAADAVTTAKIADSQVTSAKIAAGTIVASDIADATITQAKMAARTVGGVATGSFNGTADHTGTISFGVTFAAAPVVVGTAQVGSNVDLVLNWTSDPTTTGVAYRVVQKDGTVQGLTNYEINWIAFGAV